eukprot:7892454-Lingulodinium_polyedra.AAC.1
MQGPVPNEGACLLESGKAVLRPEAERAIDVVGPLPVLTSCSSDSTPITKVVQHLYFQSAMGRKQTKKVGKEQLEFFVQSQFLQYYVVAG